MNEPTFVATRPHPKQTVWIWVVGAVLALLLVCWGTNYLLVGRPVSAKLAADSRNSGYSLGAHFSYYVDFSTLVLDLRKAGEVAPVDLYRGLFQSAEALNDAGRKFNRVVLARKGKPVFIMPGTDFDTLGAEFAAGQNPIYLMRTLPEKLHLPNGEAAFGHREGGLLGVLGGQLEDMSTLAQQWVQGR